jgi:hypothetical protein
MPETSTAPSLACSFCTKLPSAVATLIQGPGVFICNECVDLCTQIIATKAEITADRPIGGWEQKMSDEDLLAHLPRVAAASLQVDQQLTTWVRQARGRGITWTRIGEALGMTRQSAWERFSGED